MLAIQRALLAWYAAHGRDLPWRRTQDPYRTLVAEVMLQQTGVGRVREKYEAFLERFPTLEALSEAPTAEVIRAWTGMGYNRRAVNLQRAARAILADHGGRVPAAPAALRALPGVGPYTAAALACFAFGRDVAVVDTNIRRVLGRLLQGPATLSLPAAWRLAEEAVPLGHAPAWNQALMDLGATICLPERPRCPACPARALCAAAPAFEADPSGGTGTQVAERRATPYLRSTRYYRGRIVQALRESAGPLDLAALGPLVRPDYTNERVPWLVQLLDGLVRDGLVRVRDGEAALP